MRFLPSISAVEAATPQSRDRALDLIRLVSLLVVVTGHGVMLLVTIRPDRIAFGNLLSEAQILQAATWLLQVLPLFFFAGAASSLLGWRPGLPWGTWLLHRAQRLFRPIFYYLAAWAVLLTIVHRSAPAAVAERIASISTQLLWFIGVYVMVLAAVPALAAMRTGRALASVVIGLYAGAAVVDMIRFDSGPAWLGYLNLTVWLIPAALGVGYVRGLITPWTALVTAGVVFLFDVLLVIAGPYELSLVTVDGQAVSNMTPPSLLLAGHAIVLSLLFVAFGPVCAAIARRPAVWRLVVIGNRGAMTLYLWHMPALLAVVYVGHVLGFDRSDPGQPGFATLVLVQLVALYGVTTLFLVGLGGLESRPLPWWDDPIGHLRPCRDAAVGAAVFAAGALTLLSAKWGLAGAGVPCILAALAAVAVARALAHPPIRSAHPEARDWRHGRRILHNAADS